MINEYECWYCDEKVPLREEPTKRVLCEKCYDIKPKEYNNIINEYKKLKNLVMFETALKMLEKTNLYLYEYKKSANIIYEMFINKKIQFNSSHEIAAAIILNDYNFKFKVNYDILKYKVDFYIPELKVCLEIDGRLHKHSKLHDNSRDIDIRNELGKQWEVIRIPTRVLEEKPSDIIDIIELLYNKKKDIRAKNHGILPEYYSERERTHYNNILFK